MSSPLQPPADVTTFVCPHLDVAHRPGTNLVWSAGLALGWKKLIERAGGPIELAGVHPDKPTAELVRALNQNAAELGTLPPGVAVGWAGHPVEPGLGELQRDIAHVFGDEHSVTLPDTSDADRITIAGGFAMHPRFAMPFARSRRPIRDRERHIQGFGLWYDESEPFECWEQRAAQVIVHFPRWTDEELRDLSEEQVDAAYNQLVVELRLTDPSIGVFLAMIEPAATLQRTVERALLHVQDDGTTSPMAHLTTQECLRVPVLDIRLEAVFRDAVDLPMTNAALRGERLGELRHAIRFRLDEGGPGAVSSSKKPFGSALMLPRRWYDSFPQFLVLVVDRRTNAPHFAAWAARPSDLSAA